MKIPLKPPALNDLAEHWGDQLYNNLMMVMDASIGPTDTKGRYLHWDKVRHLVPPANYTPELYWLSMRDARRRMSKTLPFVDKQSVPFTFCLPDSVMRDILWISENATGAIQGDARISDDQTRQTYLINTLIEEAINSSQLEGASTTRGVAKEMIRTGRAPQDHSEKMILNNFKAMSFIRDMKEEQLTPSIIFELHNLLTEGTLAEEDQNKAGIFRDSSDDICVYSKDDVLLHIPPKASELAERLQRLCDFANKKNEDETVFIPPIIRAIIVHFMIGYDHPFVDGNGRTARALFYWIMVREAYWLMEYISISRVIKKAPAQYMYAYLHSENDGNDVSYFIIHQLGVIRTAIDELHLYLAEKTRQQRETEEILKNSSLHGVLNFRQISLIRNALKNPGFEYTIKSHQASHGVVYQTARTDLLQLSDKYKLLRKGKSGKQDIFIAPANLAELIETYRKK